MDRLRWERYLADRGYQIAGFDEVGRGPLAGPVVAACVVLPLDLHLPGIKDSKALTPKARKRLYQEIGEIALGIGLGKVSPLLIDRMNIHKASLLAMYRALRDLSPRVDYLLIDGVWTIPFLSRLPQRPLIRGEDRSLSIAAASIVAKIKRDEIMERMALCYPEYGFEDHKGYPTPMHLKALERYGPSPVHRRSFRHVTHQQLSIFNF